MNNIFERLGDILRPEPQKDASYFAKKEARILAAYERVKKHLAYLSENVDNLTEIEVNDWNKWHDLEDRLTDRLKDNASNFYDWHWNKYGFNVY